MEDSFKNHYFLAQNFDNQALKLHLLQLQILLSEDSQYNFFLPRFGLEKRDLLVFENVKYFPKSLLDDTDPYKNSYCQPPSAVQNS